MFGVCAPLDTPEPLTAVGVEVYDHLQWQLQEVSDWEAVFLGQTEKRESEVNRYIWDAVFLWKGSQTEVQAGVL